MEDQEEQLVLMVKETDVPPIHPYNLPTNSCVLRCVYRKHIRGSL